MSEASAGSAPWPAALLAVYPRRWRERYGDEVGQLVTDLRASGRASFPMAVDMLCGAVAAWLADGRIEMTERSRDALISVLWNWVAFAAVAAWFGHDLGIYPTRSVAQELAVSHPLVPDAFHVLFAAGAVGVTATAIAAVVFAVDAARFALQAKNRRTFALMAVPVVTAALWIGGAKILPAGNRVVGMAFAVSWLLLGVAGIAVSTQAVVSVIKATEFGERTWRAGGAAAAAVVATMVVATGATIIWGIAVRATLAHPGDATGWIVVTAVMAVTTARALAALVRGRREPVSQPAVV